MGGAAPTGPRELCSSGGRPDARELAQPTIRSSIWQHCTSERREDVRLARPQPQVGQRLRGNPRLGCHHGPPRLDPAPRPAPRKSLRSDGAFSDGQLTIPGVTPNASMTVFLGFLSGINPRCDRSIYTRSIAASACSSTEYDLRFRRGLSASNKWPALASARIHSSRAATARSMRPVYFASVTAAWSASSSALGPSRLATCHLHPSSLARRTCATRVSGALRISISTSRSIACCASDDIGALSQTGFMSGCFMASMHPSSAAPANPGDHLGPAEAVGVRTGFSTTSTHRSRTHFHRSGPTYSTSSAHPSPARAG
jgi:hypothetical protein